MKGLGLILILFACFFGFYESSHFGWNLFPKSGAELACDVICLLALFAGEELLRKG